LKRKNPQVVRRRFCNANNKFRAALSGFNSATFNYEEFFDFCPSSAGRRVLQNPGDSSAFSFVGRIVAVTTATPAAEAITVNFVLDPEILKAVVVAIVSNPAAKALIENATGTTISTPEAFKAVFAVKVVTTQATVSDEANGGDDVEAPIEFVIIVDNSGEVTIGTAVVTPAPAPSSDDDDWFIRLYIIIMWIMGYFNVGGGGGSYGFWG
jgi:hypothetical protein